MGLSNDERGWIMTCLSGIACVLGASIICVDIVIRQFPGKRNFRIQDSDTFLSASLSLSFGVMLFSALYSMLPSAKSSLVKGGFDAKAAAWILIGCFIGGVVGIQFISRILHRFMPSHVVDCEHSHEDEEAKEPDHDQNYDSPQQSMQSLPPQPMPPRRSSLPGHMMTPGAGRRKTPRQSSYFGGNHTGPESTAALLEEGSQVGHLQLPARRPSLHERVTSTLTRVASRKPECDCNGPCHGFSDPCGQDCFKSIKARGGFRAPTRMSSGLNKPALTKSATSQLIPIASEATPLLQDIAEEPRPRTEHIQQAPTRYDTALTSPSHDHQAGGPSEDSSDTLNPANENESLHLHKTHSNETTSSHNPEHHHHHVPTNAFMSIGLQTSIAIALHKLPEGFITYATNHANPSLGVSVFLALFIHNITEGFAMALPLYLAINSRWKAMVISFVLGGLSQPMGAGVAAVWFALAGDGKWRPDEGIYGGMFAVTAGIMASVALQLFSEALDLSHSRTLCMLGAFCGMGILGISSALTA